MTIIASEGDRNLHIHTCKMLQYFDHSLNTAVWSFESKGNKLGASWLHSDQSIVSNRNGTIVDRVTGTKLRQITVWYLLDDFPCKENCT